MSTIHPTNDRPADACRNEGFKSMSPRERLLGMLVLILVLLLAIVLQWM